MDLLTLVSHPHALVRARSCVVLRLLACHCGEALQPVWPPRLPERLEALRLDEEQPAVQQVRLIPLTCQPQYDKNFTFSFWIRREIPMKLIRRKNKYFETNYELSYQCNSLEVESTQKMQ